MHKVCAQEPSTRHSNPVHTREQSYRGVHCDPGGRPLARGKFIQFSRCTLAAGDFTHLSRRQGPRLAALSMMRRSRLISRPAALRRDSAPAVVGSVLRSVHELCGEAQQADETLTVTRFRAGRLGRSRSRAPSKAFGVTGSAFLPGRHRRSSSGQGHLCRA